MKKELKDIISEPLNNLPYHDCIHTYKNRLKENLPAVLPENIKGLILEWGCSEGLTTLDLADLYKNSKVIGLDRCGLALSCTKDYLDSFKHEKENPNLPSFILADGYVLPFKQESFDAVFCLNSLFYSFINPNYSGNIKSAIFSNVASLLKEGGYFVIGADDRKPVNYLTFQRKNESLKLLNSLNLEHKLFQKLPNHLHDLKTIINLSNKVKFKS